MSRERLFTSCKNFLWDGRRTTDVPSENSCFVPYVPTSLDTGERYYCPERGLLRIPWGLCVKNRNLGGNRNKLLKRVTYSTLVATLTYVPTFSQIPLDTFAKCGEALWGTPVPRTTRNPHISQAILFAKTIKTPKCDSMIPNTSKMCLLLPDYGAPLIRTEYSTQIIYDTRKPSAITEHSFCLTRLVHFRNTPTLCVVFARTVRQNRQNLSKSSIVL